MGSLKTLLLDSTKNIGDANPLYNIWCIFTYLTPTKKNMLLKAPELNPSFLVQLHSIMRQQLPRSVNMTIRQQFCAFKNSSSVNYSIVTFNSNVTQWICWTSLQLLPCRNCRNLTYIFIMMHQVKPLNSNEWLSSMFNGRHGGQLFLFISSAKALCLLSFFFHRRKILYQRLPRYPPVVPFPYLNVGPVSKQVATASPGGPTLISPEQISAIRLCHRTLLQEFSGLRCP